MTQRVRVALLRPYRAVPVTLALGFLALFGVAMVWYGVVVLRAVPSGGAWVGVISMGLLTATCTLGLLGMWRRAVCSKVGAWGSPPCSALAAGLRSAT